MLLLNLKCKTRRMITAGYFYYWVNSHLMPAALRLIILR